MFGLETCSYPLHVTLDESSSSNHVICGAQVNRVNWKKFLKKFFKLPINFKLSAYHVFYFCTSFLDGLMVKSLCTNTTWICYKLKKESVSITKIRLLSEELFHNPDFRLIVRSLSEMPSAQEQTLESYLVKNELDCYYRNDEKKREEYFSSGSDRCT